MQSVSLSREMERALVALGADVDRMRIERRAAQVRAMWADIVDEPIVRHTNAVYIKRTDAGKELIAYVDESMYAAELNARRELIKPIPPPIRGGDRNVQDPYLARQV